MGNAPTWKFDSKFIEMLNAQYHLLERKIHGDLRGIINNI